LPAKMTVPIANHHREAADISSMQVLHCNMVKVSNQLSHIRGFNTFPSEPPYEIAEQAVEQMGLLEEEIDSIMTNFRSQLETFTDILNLPQADIKGFFRAVSSANRELGQMYLENQKTQKQLAEKTAMLDQLNKLSRVFLEEKNPEELLKECCELLLNYFGFNQVWIEYYLGRDKSILVKSYFPRLYASNGKKIKSQEIEKTSRVVARDTAVPEEGMLSYNIHPEKGEQIGKIYISSDLPVDPEGFNPFLDEINLGMKNLKLHLTNRLKTEKLNIAVKQASEENAKTKRLSRFNKLILENSPVGIITVDGEGRILQYNREACRVLSQQDLGNRKFSDLDIFIRNNLQGTIDELVQNNQSRDITAAKHQKRHYLYIKSAHIEGTPNTLVLISDITRRKENEEAIIQKEKMATLGELAAGIAHNLRSPLAVIKGIPELILSRIKEGSISIYRKQKGKQVQDQEVADNMDLVSRSMEKALAIIDSIMDFSKTRPAQKEKVDVYHVVNEAFLLMEQRIKEKEARFENETRGCSVYGNKNMLIQVFVNLLNNSIDAIEKQGSIKVACRHKNKNLVIHFTDDGAGISESNREKIFEPFFTTSGKANGTGIGLSITRKIITAHGGTIKAYPREGGGTLMEIIIPEKGNGHDQGIDNRR
ncbi:MAG: sensor histidine kinase, partial [Spirochaetota bacterium]